MPPREDYQYLSLHDAYHARQSLVHVYGIVTEFTSPRPTRGTDYMSHVKIADPTVRDIRSGDDSRTFTDVQVQFFASRENLPRPRKVGDIIRLHRVEVKQWNGRPQFIAKVGVLQGGAAAGGWARCQFLLFDGDDDASDDPYQQSSNGYTFDVAKDGAQLARLRKHWMDIGGAAALDSGFTIAIQAIRYSENYDLHVRVLDVVNVDGRVTLIVWDGSDARPFPPGWRTNNMGVGGDSQSQEASEMIGREGVHFAPFAADQPLTEAASAEYRERRGDVPRIGTAFPVVMRQFDMQDRGSARARAVDSPPKAVVVGAGRSTSGSLRATQSVGSGGTQRVVARGVRKTTRDETNVDVGARRPPRGRGGGHSEPRRPPGGSRESAADDNAASGRAAAYPPRDSHDAAPEPTQVSRARRGSLPEGRARFLRRQIRGGDSCWGPVSRGETPRRPRRGEGGRRRRVRLGQDGRFRTRVRGESAAGGRDGKTPRASLPSRGAHVLPRHPAV